MATAVHQAFGLSMDFARYFVDGMARDHRSTAPSMSDAEFMHMQSLDDLVWAAQIDVRTYLYGNGIDEAAEVDPNDPGIVSMANAVAGELNSPRRDTFTSPQRHSFAALYLRHKHPDLVREFPQRGISV